MWIKPTTLKEILQYEGFSYRANIYTDSVEGRLNINLKGSIVYLCHDKHEGARADNLYGYKSSWGMTEFPFESINELEIYIPDEKSVLTNNYEIY